MARHVVDALEPLARAGDDRAVTRARRARRVIRGDRDEIIQVLQNLIENACKYGREGGRVEVAL